MKKFMVIGLGNFGYNVAKTLFELGNEVIAVDRDPEKVQQISDYSSRAMISDSQNKEFLRASGAAEMDAVILSLGDNISQSIITTLYLKELRVAHIIAKANNQDHGKVLSKVGADRVVFPEQEMAVKLARSMTSPAILDSMQLSSEYALAELLSPLEFVGQSLLELDLRKTYRVFVMAVKEAVPERITVLPSADFRIKDSDVLVLFGLQADIALLEKRSRKTD